MFNVTFTTGSRRLRCGGSNISTMHTLSKPVYGSGRRCAEPASITGARTNCASQPPSIKIIAVAAQLQVQTTALTMNSVLRWRASRPAVA